MTECSSTHRCRSKQAKDFSRISPKLARKVVVRLLPTIFLPQRSWRPLLVWPPENRFLFVFLQMLGAISWSQTTLGAILSSFSGMPRHLGILPRFSRFCPNFQGFCPDFWKIRTFGGVLAPSAPPPPTPMAVLVRCFSVCSSSVLSVCRFLKMFDFGDRQVILKDRKLTEHKRLCCEI